MKRLLRGVSLQTLSELLLLLLAMSAFVGGLSGVVRGAAVSAFLPAAMLAVLLGWYFSRTRLKSGPGLAGLFLVGLVYLWGRTAQSGPSVLAFITLVAKTLLKNFLRFHGLVLGSDESLALEVQVALQNLTAQSMALWMRTQAWLLALRAGVNVNDPVVRVMLWSTLIWILALWAGWYVGRRQVLAGLAPGLMFLAFVTQYTNASLNPLWWMCTCLLGLISLSRFDDNFRRWVATRLDYAELVVSQTMLAAILLTLSLAGLGWVLPRISVHDFLESMRRQTVSENQAARTLGLDPAPKTLRPVPSALQAARSPGLPNYHLLGSGSELAKDLVFTVSTGEFPPESLNGPMASGLDPQTSYPRHYWRSLSFDVYTGSGWFSSTTKMINSAPDEPLYEIPPGYSLLKQDFDLKHGEEGNLYWSGSLYRSNLPFQAAWRNPPGQSLPLAVDPFRGADLYGALNSSAKYSVESLLPVISEEELRAAGRETPDFIQKRYVQLPASVPERVFALARDLTSTAESPYAEALALESYLRVNYPYTLDVSTPPLGVDVADYFLFTLKRGYCDYYATAMVVMARSLGLPARLVTGYESGTYDPQRAIYRVTAADAHAWVEIYFPGIGWVEFEPTAGSPALGRTGGTALLPAAVKPVNPAAWGRLVRSIYTLPQLGRWLLTVLVGMLGFAALFFVLESWLLSLVRSELALRWMVAALYRQTRRFDSVPAPGRTANEFADNLQTYLKKEDGRLGLLITLYQRVLFSTRTVTKIEIKQAIAAWRALRWEFLWKRGKKQNR
ncbi:MAG: transglutaminase domain-containing protein [Chloroflexota bacterium]